MKRISIKETEHIYEGKEAAVANYFHGVIEKSWTWGRLTEKERQIFTDMNIFNLIRGTEDQRVEWLYTIYEAFLCGLGCDSVEWRENKS